MSVCNFVGHKWGRWLFGHHFIDTSWGGHAKSAMFYRECKRCGLVRKKSLYGHIHPTAGGLP